MSTRFDPSKRTHKVVTAVHDDPDDKYSHAIPVVPEFSSDTVYDFYFYEDRRAENARLAGLAIEYTSDGGSGSPPNITIGTATIFGDVSVLDGTTHTYSVSIDGTVDIDDCTVVYTTDKPGDVVSGDTITFNGDGIENHTVTATITHPTAVDSPVTATYVVEVKGAPGFDNFSTSPSGGSAITFGRPFSTEYKGMDPGYKVEDYMHFYTIVGTNTAQAYVRVVNQVNKEPYWVYDVSKAPFNNTPCVVTETFTLKTDPSVTASFNTGFTLHNY